MTTLVFGVAGAVIGNFIAPGIGTSIGFMVGSMVGGLVDPPKSEGPRLTDLKLQKASYGQMVPFIWGRGRIAGVIIDQTDLEEHAHKSGGKGGPQITNYTYTASFDILLCETTRFGQDAIIGCSRIWWNSRLLWTDASGDPMPCTLYVGSETQLPDPTFEAVHSPEPVPAYRGFAHAVFTDKDLTDGGNTIGNWEFELYTIGAPGVPIHEVASNHSEPFEWPIFVSGEPPPPTEIPVITQWDGWDNTTTIRVRNRIGTDVQVYNNDPGLAWTDSQYAGSGDTFPLDVVVESGSHGLFSYAAIGHYRYDDGSTVTLWVCPRVVIGTMYALMTASPYLNVATDTPGPLSSFATVAGLDPARYIGGTSLSEDGRILLVFTSPIDPTLNAECVDQWHKIIDGVIVAEGDITPPLDKTELGFSQSSGIYYNSLNMLENNGDYMWFYYIAGSPAIGITLYSIVGSTFAIDAVGGRANLGATEGPIRGAVRVIGTGLFGIVAGTTVAVWSRLGALTNDVPLSTIVSDLSDMTPAVDQYDVAELTDLVHWYVVASQMTVRNAIQPLRQAFFFDAVESDDVIKFLMREREPEFSIPDDDLCAHAYGDDPGTPLKTIRKKEVDLPRNVSFTYINIDADYQPGVETSHRQVVRSESDVSVQVPVGFTSEEAAQSCETLQATEWIEREGFEWYTSRKWAALEPCTIGVVRGRVIRIQTRTEQPNGVIKWTGVLADPSIYTQTTIGSGSGAAGEGSGGFVPQEPPPPDQLTALILLDVPIISNPAQQSVYHAAMNGADRPAWRGASLQRSIDGGTNYSEIASSITPDITGIAQNALGDFPGGNVFDEANALTVVIGPGGGELESVSRLAVLNGSNRALVGAAGRWELIQYRTATLTATSTYVLTGLLRGRNGTEWARSSHAIGDTFVIVPTTVELVAPFGDYGIERQYKAVTIGQTLASAATQNFTPLGVALTPYCPVHLGAGQNSSGDWILSWTRRARVNGAWQNYVDVPLDESTEFYKIYLYTDDTYSTIVTDRLSPVTTLTLTVAQQTTIYGSPQSVIYWIVVQVGSLGPGYDQFGNAESLGTM